jgi:hypothetical protein
MHDSDSSVALEGHARPSTPYKPCEALRAGLMRPSRALKLGVDIMRITGIISWVSSGWRDRRDLMGHGEHEHLRDHVKLDIHGKACESSRYPCLKHSEIPKH